MPSRYGTSFSTLTRTPFAGASKVTLPSLPRSASYLEPYAEAARAWLHDEAEVVDTTHLTPAQAAQQIAEAVKS
jgi:hypothetical protein